MNSCAGNSYIKAIAALIRHSAENCLWVSIGERTTQNVESETTYGVTALNLSNEPNSGIYRTAVGTLRRMKASDTYQVVVH